MKRKAFLKRFSNKIFTIFYTQLSEKTYKLSDNRVKYLFFPKKKASILLIGFQACTDKGSRYNYLQTLKGLNVNRLYIRDDFAKNKRGNYYLGCNGRYDIESGVFSLIDQYIKKTKPSRLVFIGSSKGAYAALNFGIRYPGSHMIIASPQYFLGNYLSIPMYKDNLEDIIGDITEDKVARLNSRLQKKLMDNQASGSQKIFIHYSDKEDTFERHIKDLLENLKAKPYSIEEDVMHYTNHMDLRFYFPDYMYQKIRELTNAVQ